MASNYPLQCIFMHLGHSVSPNKINCVILATAQNAALTYQVVWSSLHQSGNPLLKCSQNQVKTLKSVKLSRKLSTLWLWQTWQISKEIFTSKKDCLIWILSGNNRTRAITLMHIKSMISIPKFHDADTMSRGKCPELNRNSPKEFSIFVHVAKLDKTGFFSDSKKIIFFAFF